MFLRQKPTELIASRTLFKKNKNKTLRDIFKHKKNYPRWKHGNEENVKYWRSKSKWMLFLQNNDKNALWGLAYV